MVSMRRAFAPIVVAAVSGCATTHPLATTQSSATAHPSWSYEGASGPARWSELSPEFAQCSTGKRQSPIDISGQAGGELTALVFDYETTALTLHHNGHTVEVKPAAGEILQIGPRRYPLAQLHFHRPSEHTVEGQRFPLEIHMVHKGSEGTVVVGLLVEEGAPSPLLETLVKQLPRTAGADTAIDGALDLRSLLPDDLATFHYDGSLTVPPCTEGVSWWIVRAPISASKEQLAAFEAVLSPNSRPVQPRNDRPILRSP